MWPMDAHPGVRWRYAHTVLALCTLAFTATMVARLVPSPVVPAISADFDVSTGAIGFAFSLMWGAYALSQFPSGILGDRFGERRVILVAVGTTAAASVLLALSPSYPVFLLVAMFLGGGAGLHYSVATSLFAREFDDIGQAIGIHIAGGPIAGLVAPVAAALVAARVGWRGAMLLGAVVAAPAFVLFAWRVRPTPPARPETPMRDRLELSPVAELLSRPTVLFTTAVTVVGAFTWQATAAFVPSFLIVYHGFSETAASLLFSFYFVVNGVLGTVMGSLSDRFGRDRTAAVTMASGVAGYGLLVVGEATLTAVVPAVTLVGLAMSWGAPLQSRYLDAFDDAERGAGFGLVRTVYMTIGASGSVVVGVLSDVSGWGTAFGLLAALMAVGFVLLVGNRALGIDL